MATHFTKEIQLRFREADPAGILFFGNIFGLAHDCFEDFIQDEGWGWDRWFKTPDFIIPMRHTESHYFKPFHPGEKYQITASVAHLGDSSFQMKYRFTQGDVPHAEVRMTHVFVNPQTMKKTSMPLQVREFLKVYLDVKSAK